MTLSAAVPASPLLTAPIGASIARLALPTVAVMIVQTAVSIAETAIVGRLGTEALAGFALAFPLVMLMSMMAAGGIGGGIAAALARATGGGRHAEAAALVPHALALATGFALGFTLLMTLGGPAIFRALGGEGPALAYAIAYSDILFLGAIAHWAMFGLSAILRGTGNAALPGKIMLVASLAQIPLTWVLVLGVGGWQGQGIAGAAVASIAAAGAAALCMLYRIYRGALGFAPGLGPEGWRWPLFAAILRVGLMSSLSALLANFTTILVTFLVGGFGVAALAAYGVGARLEFMLVPLIFGIGSALTTLVGAAVGAGDFGRARRVAWSGALAAAALTGAVGLFGALAPASWIGLFSDDPAVLAFGRPYLVYVAPFYAAFGLGMALNFATQGTGRMFWPLSASVVRLLLATLGGWLAIQAGLGLEGLFAMVGLALLSYGAAIGLTMWLIPWGAGRTSARSR